jgi:transforming growth factor-beta-induced protein
MRRMVLIVIAVLLLVVVPTFAQEQNIVEIAAGNSDFSTLVAAVQAADPAIVEALSGEGPLTLFAPTNAAFEALLTSLNLTADELLANTELLNQVLLYHVVSGSVLAADVIELDGQSVPTLLEGESINVSVVDGGVVLNDSINVVTTDIIASNGVIHVIDSVLLPQVVLNSLSQPEATGFVNIRVAHLSPDTPAVDVYVNGEAAITALEYPNVTSFITLPAGSYELAVAPAGTSIEEAAIGPASFDLPANSFITVAAVGSLANGTLAPAVFTRDFSEIPADTARVLVFHAIEDAPAVDVRANGSVLVSSLAFPGTFTTTEGVLNDGAFEIDVPAGTYDLAVVPSGATEPVVLDLSGTTFEAGVYYLVAAVGTLESPSVSVATVDAATAQELRNALQIPAEGPTQTIAEIAASNEDFSILLAAVQAADPAIAEALSGEGALTVFAPTNAAFEALLTSLDLTAEELLANTELLNQVLLYHVVEGSFAAGDVVGLDGQTVPTLLEGETISVSVTDNGVVLNDNVNVVATDIFATNGVVHVIDAVLLPQAVLTSLGQ